MLFMIHKIILEKNSIFIKFYLIIRTRTMNEIEMEEEQIEEEENEKSIDSKDS